MSESEVTLVRIYLSEGDHLVEHLLTRLHDEEKVRGVTVFRGVSGFGQSGRMHGGGLLDLSLDLPLVVEFFDAPERVAAILADLADELDPQRVVSWPARLGWSA